MISLHVEYHPAQISKNNRKYIGHFLIPEFNERITVLTVFAMSTDITDMLGSIIIIFLRIWNIWISTENVT